MVLGLVVAQLGTLGEFVVGVRRNKLQAIVSHWALSFSGDWSLRALIGKLGGWRRRGVQN
jgi:hypothetical protein